MAVLARGRTHSADTCSRTSQPHRTVKRAASKQEQETAAALYLVLLDIVLVVLLDLVVEF